MRFSGGRRAAGGWSLLIALLFWLLASTARGEEEDRMRLLGGTLAPYAFMQQGVVTGLGVDLMRELSIRVGQPATVELVPFPRALLRARRQPDILMTPVARVSEREGELRWAMHYVDDLFFYVTRKGSPPLDHASARDRGVIGVLGGSAPLAELKRAGIENFQQQTLDIVNIQMLQNRRVDGWFTSAILLAAALRQNPALNPADFTLGPVQSRHCVYIITSTQTTDKALEPWLRAFEQIRDEGILQRLITRHLGEPLGQRVAPDPEGCGAKQG